MMDVSKSIGCLGGTGDDGEIQESFHVVVVVVLARSTTQKSNNIRKSADYGAPSSEWFEEKEEKEK